MDQERIIFLLGAPRSGTTLLQKIMNSHPDIAGGPEFDRIPDIIELRNKLHTSISNGRIEVFCTHSDVDKYISVLVESLLLPYANKSQCNYVSEKTPDNLLVFPDLVTLLPSAKYIFCVRDPRSVINSMLEVGLRAREKKIVVAKYAYSVRLAVKALKEYYRKGFQGVSQLEGNVLILKYEDLVLSPNEITKSICQYLNVNWTVAMVSPEKNEHDGAKVLNSERYGIYYDKESYYKSLSSDSINKWEKGLSRREVIIISRAFEMDSELAKLGYDFSIKDVNIFEKGYFVLFDLGEKINALWAYLLIRIKEGKTGYYLRRLKRYL